MSRNDIDRLWVLDLACMKHCGKQLPILTLVTVFDYVQYMEEIDRLEEAKKRRTQRRPKNPHCPEGTSDVMTLVVKGARKKKWTPRKENRQVATHFRMRKALRFHQN